MRTSRGIVLYVVAMLTLIGEVDAAERVTPGRVLSVYFDIVATDWAGQPEVYDPNLIFIEFRGGVTFSHNAVVTATLYVDGVDVGSTTTDFACSLCSSPTWQFAAAGFPSVHVFPNPTIVDFSRVQPGAKGVITLRVERGFMHFGNPPYERNAPVVVFDNIWSCGSGCTSIRPVTMDAQNLLYEVTHR